MTTDIERATAILSLEYNLLSPDAALDIIRRSAGDQQQVLTRLIADIPEAALLEAIGREMGFAYVDLFGTRVGLTHDQELISRADPDFLRRYSALPLYDADRQVVVAVSNPTDQDLRSYLRQVYPEMRLVIASKSQIQARLAMSNQDILQAIEAIEPEAPATVKDAQPAVQRNPLVSWVDNVLETAVAQGVSDIHFEHNADHTLMLRFRIDGVLRLQPAPLKSREAEVIGIIMNKSGMDSANQREPQDGTFSFVASDRKIDVRAAMLPQENGPSVVLRLLDSNNVRRRLADMGFSASQLSSLRRAATSPQGTIIVCGPTGSGKTTTLYALLREVTTIEKNIVTIEDPVEYRLPMVNQTAISHGIDGKAMGFARALRAIMRMDPDVLLVGEIRDTETAKTAMDAAITGHLVLSTVHARDAVGIYTRLSEMGVPGYMVAEAMTLGVSQRLTRRLHDCAVLGPPTQKDIALFTQINTPVPQELMQPTGCDACDGSGYRGRIAIVEVLEPSKKFRSMVLAGVGHDALIEQARADGFVPMIEEGLRLVREHASTIEEVLRTVEAA